MDFYLPKYKIGIECQGIQHFEKVDYFGGEIEFNSLNKRDKAKKQICVENNIRLFYYTKIKKYNLFLDEYLFHDGNKLIEEIEKYVV